MTDKPAWHRWAAAGLLSGLTSGLFGMGIVHAASVDPADVLAAYVLLTQNQDSGETVALARVVLAGAKQDCPAISAVSGITARINPDPDNFPITVCEGLYASQVAVNLPGSSLSLPAIEPAPTNVMVFGDSGYKSKQLSESDGWPFPDLAKQAARQAPDLILHMGDYNYSGTPGEIEVHGDSVQVYDAGDNTTQGMCRIPGGYHGQNSPGSTSPDTWVAWKSNFFDAAQGLLSAAPFVFARGNHELCSRAGTGWFYLLDSNSPLLGKYAQQLSCPTATNPTPMVMTPPYVVSTSTLNLLVLDSTNACDSGLLNLDEYINQFTFLRQLADNATEADQTWLVSHRPIWGVDRRDSVGACGDPTANGGGDNCYITQTLQAANAETGLTDAVNLIVSGHMHRFQVVDFKDDAFPAQFIIGNSGVELDGNYPKQTTELSIDGETATVTGASKFGYMHFGLSGPDWSAALVGLENGESFGCRSARYPMCSD